MSPRSLCVPERKVAWGAKVDAGRAVRHDMPGSLHCDSKASAWYCLPKVGGLGTHRKHPLRGATRRWLQEGQWHQTRRAPMCGVREAEKHATELARSILTHRMARGEWC
eukprot:9786124-Alexandrium_andersonii.AAC.1